MADSQESSTGTTTLFGLLRETDNREAWGRFVDRYGPVIHRWCLSRRLKEPDAQDIAQNVYVNMVRGIGTYQPEKGGFRPWMATVVHNAWCDFLRRQGRGVAAAAGGSDVQRDLL